MPPVMFDSSIYIAALRIRHDAALELRRLAGGEPIWLSSVVLEELYAGASVKNRHIVERFERDFDRAGRFLVPNLKDWAQAGKVLALVAAEYDFGQIGRGRLTKDWGQGEEVVRIVRVEKIVLVAGELICVIRHEAKWAAQEKLWAWTGVASAEGCGRLRRHKNRSGCRDGLEKLHLSFHRRKS